MASTAVTLTSAAAAASRQASKISTFLRIIFPVDKGNPPTTTGYHYEISSSFWPMMRRCWIGVWGKVNKPFVLLAVAIKIEQQQQQHELQQQEEQQHPKYIRIFLDTQAYIQTFRQTRRIYTTCIAVVVRCTVYVHVYVYPVLSCKCVYTILIQPLVYNQTYINNASFNT